MATLTKHWTEGSIEDFLYRLAADFVRQIEKAMGETGVNQGALAKRLGVSEGRVSQVLNNPGNLTLKKMVEYARALGRKVSIVEYNDDDPDNVRGPISSEIFAECWHRTGMPNDFFALDDAANTMTYEIRPCQPWFPMWIPIRSSKKAGNRGNVPIRDDQSADTVDIRTDVRD